MSYRDLLFHSREENKKRIRAVWRITEIANRVWGGQQVHVFVTEWSVTEVA